MKYTARLGERGQVVIPKPIRDSLGLAKNACVDFEVKDHILTLTPKRDMRRFDEAIRKYKGSMRKQMLADGYASVDELMKDLRGR